MDSFKNPALAVDILVVYKDEQGAERFLVIERKNEPHGWALPGGFVDEGESLVHAAQRELREETGLDVPLEHFRQWHAYSEPSRDPRKHVVSVAFWVTETVNQQPKAQDDAKSFWGLTAVELAAALRREANFFVFDHRSILLDFAVRRARPQH